MPRKPPPPPITKTAINVVARAVRKGILKRPDACQLCGSEKRVIAHHADYSKPLEVVWVCDKCHRAIHRNGRGENAESKPQEVLPTPTLAGQGLARKRWAKRTKAERKAHARMMSEKRWEGHQKKTS